ncbi:unnamed protein product [Rhizophagus irregularis]|nr:unnamed protein product [Rhizophagus irregularis]CAB4442998.1 unnamed protein product [Rhizophagus irregularis]
MRDNFIYLFKDKPIYAYPRRFIYFVDFFFFLSFCVKKIGTPLIYWLIVNFPLITSCKKKRCNQACFFEIT